MLSQLFNLLPVLALLDIVLTGIENIPSALAHQHASRGREHHRHLITRQKARDSIASQVKKRKAPSGAAVRRGADGEMCRVRGAAQTLTGAKSSTTVAAIATTTSTTQAPSSVATQTSTSVAIIPSATTTTLAGFVQVTYTSTNTQSYDVTASSTPASSIAVAVLAPAQSSSAPAAIVSSYSGSTTSGWTNPSSKFGAAWPNGNWAAATDPDYIGNYIGKQTSWYYTWSPFSVASADQSGLEYVPMLWGPKQVGDWYAQQASWPSTVKNALFFNEPNESSQCNMAASDSVSYWMNEMVPLKSKGISLGGAATTSAPSGLQWVLDFQKACVGAGNSAADCTPSFIPIHWYDTTPENFQAYVENFHAQTGLDIWITEYACQNFNNGPQCTNDQTWALHQSMAAWFDQQDYIKRYAPFGIMKQMQGVNQDNALMNPDGTITSLGSWYITQ